MTKKMITKNIAAKKSLEKAKEIILQNLPTKNIISIYVGGSYIRDEMTDKSDVDTWTIVDDNSLMEPFEKLAEQVRNTTNPPISLAILSLWELENDKIFNSSNKPKGRPSRFTKMVPYYKLLYGNPLNIRNLPVKSDKYDFVGLIKAFRNEFLPRYYQQKFGFNELINQLFWVIWFEQRLKGNDVGYSWKKLDETIKDPQHIIHKTWYYRNNHTTDEKKRAEFVKDLEEYLGKIE